MGFEDRDYSRRPQGFELAPGVPSATKALIIIMAVGFVVAMITGNALSFATAEFLGKAATGEQELAAYHLFVLQPQNLMPLPQHEFFPGHWKLLTHWIAPPGILALLFGGIGLYFAGRLVEPVMGARGFALFYVGTAVSSGLLAALVDPWLLGARHSVIMGPEGAITALFVAAIFLYPDAVAFAKVKLKHFIIVLLALTTALHMSAILAFNQPVVLSPTQVLFGAAMGALYMALVHKRVRLKVLARQESELDRERVGGGGSFFSGWEREFEAEDRKQREAEKKAREQAQVERDREAAERAQEDALLEKISREGIGALSRKERAFLDDRAKKLGRK